MRSIKSSRIGVFLIVLSIIYCAITFSTSFKGSSYEDFSEEMDATITKVQRMDSRSATIYKIYNEESNQRIELCFPLGEGAEIEELLQTGDKISFCVKAAQLQVRNESMSLNVLFLEKDGQVIYSLEDYNRYAKAQDIHMKIIGLGVTCAFGALGVFATCSKKRKV